jgi:hypothetical protein
MLGFRLGLAFLIVFLALPSSAVTIDFTTFSTGPQPYPLVIGSTTFTSESGTLDILFAGHPGLAGSSGAAADLFVSFGSPVSSVTITMGDGGGDVDRFRVSAFDFTTNALISVTDSPIFNPDHTLTVVGPNIGSLTIDPGNSGLLPGTIGPAGGVLLKVLDFTVPEPSTALLFVTGIAGLAWYGRRRH